jgi:hypothetical protein
MAPVETALLSQLKEENKQTQPLIDVRVGQGVLQEEFYPKIIGSSRTSVGRAARF